MPISSKEVIELTPHADRFRARFKYTLDDGRVLLRGPIFVRDSAAATARLNAMADDVLRNIQSHDASEAVRAGKLTAHKQATTDQVRYQFMQEGFDDVEPYKAYLRMKDIGPLLDSIGRTNEQYADAFGITVRNVEKLRARWVELKANSAIYEAYAGVI